MRMSYRNLVAGRGSITRTEPTRRECLSTGDAVRAAFDTDDTRGDDGVSGTGLGLLSRRSARALVGNKTGSSRLAPRSSAEIRVVRS